MAAGFPGDLSLGSSSETLNSRYMVIEPCGEGSFSTALRCWDLVKQRYVVLKVMKFRSKKSKHSLMMSVTRELEMLQDIQEHEQSTGVPSGCLHVHEAFEDQGKICLAMESLGLSYVELLRLNDFQSFPLVLVKSVMRQVLHSLAFLHSMGVVHLDIKPHNVLVAESLETESCSVRCADGAVRTMTLPVSSSVRLIDFGGSRYEDDQESGYNFTTEFRSPEVILDLETTTAADMWSFGTVLIQLYTGRLLFGRVNKYKSITDLEHFSLMARVLGQPYPKGMALAAREEGDYAQDVFSPTGRLLKCPTVDAAAVLTLKERVLPQDAPLLDLLQRCLQYDPANRITAQEALNHPFFTTMAAHNRHPLNVPAAPGTTIRAAAPSVASLPPMADSAGAVLLAAAAPALMKKAAPRHTPLPVVQ